ncbi:MAG TPA: carboxypeptidase-like regulatory domain-containing protein, partial [Nannocystaceae bacterium]|nr:carboxypeptidase-like regulatory domain-containing protein [Nannocystaceae bacterium]
MGVRIVGWIAALSIAWPGAAFASEPVPVQRPKGATPPTAEAPTSIAAPLEAPSVATPPADAPPADAPPADAPVAEPSTEAAAPQGDVVPPAVPKGRIAGVVLDTEQVGVGVPDVNITAVCPCLDEAIGIASDYDGRFELDELPPGTYTLHFDRGGRQIKRVVSLAEGERAKIRVDVEPPTDTKELERRDKLERRSSTMIAAGAVSALAGFVMVVAAGVEANKAPCKFGEDDCANAPRPAVAKGMGIGGALALAGGATLVLVGV